MEPQASREDAAVVGRGLDEFNAQAAGDEAYERLTIFARNADGTIVAGVFASTYWG